MGQIIGMAVTGHMAKQKLKVDLAVADAEKTIGTAENESQNMLNEVQANIQNALRGENNALLAARAALGNFQKSAKNEAILQTAGSKFNAVSTNIARISDSSRGNSLERRIQAAEQQGAVTAAFAATGTGGASQRMLRTAMAVTAARRETRAADGERQQSYDMLAQRAGIMPGAIKALDQGQTFVPIDHTVSTPQKLIMPMWQADFMVRDEHEVALMAMAGQAGQAAGSYWGRAGNGQQSGNTNGNSGGSGSDWYSSNNSAGNDQYDSGNGGYGGGDYGGDFA